MLIPSLWAADPIVTVHISGVNKEIEENIRAHLTLLHEEADELEPTRIAQYEQRATQEISTALELFGYYEPIIHSTIREQQGIWNGVFHIQLGNPTVVRKIQFHLEGQGEKDPALQHLFKLFTLKKGDIFVHDLYDQGKKALLSKTIQQGYLNAFFTQHRVEVDPESHSSEIFLTLETGSRHYFGPIQFGQTELSTSLLERYLSFHPGDVYSPEKTLALQSQLIQSEYFSQVNVKALPENDTFIPIMVELEDAKPNQYLLGAGYGTDTGIRGKLGWTRRRLNASGHRFSALAQVAEIYHKIQLQYDIPGKHPQTDQIKMKVAYFEDEFSEQKSKIFETGIADEREISGWQRQLSLNYHHEQFNAFQTNEVVQSNLILPKITFIQVKRDDALTPTRGRRIELTMSGSIDALFSDTTFFQSYLQLKWLHAINETTKVLSRAEFGFTLPDDSERLPLSQRFFAGGDLSLRGYGYRSLPNEIDKHGIRHPVGGAYLAVGSFELVKTIKKPFGVFTFIDFGNAFRTSANEIAIGTGVGVEWQTRLGPIKFAIAKPLTKQADSWRIHASFGPEL